MRTRIHVAIAFLAMAIFDWSVASAPAGIFRPAGLSPGDEYQLAFVTSGTTDATSGSIATYNDFVNQQAALNPTLTGTDVGISGNLLGVNWSAIASTPMIDARNNAEVVAPVYLFDSTRIANGFDDMWNGDLASPLSLTQFRGFPDTDVWTGTGPAGFNDGGLGLPDDASTTLGSPSDSSGGWIAFENSNSTSFNSLYALSEKLTVPSVRAAIRLDMVFTDGPNVAALDSYGLSEFPEEVHASFLLSEGTLNSGGTTSYLSSNVLSAEVLFGDGNFTSVSAFSLKVGADGNIASLGWRFNPIVTPSVTDGVITLNSPLGIFGVDRVSGESFSYTYANSIETITVVPEPSTLAMGIAFGIASALRRQRAGAALGSRNHRGHLVRKGVTLLSGEWREPNLRRLHRATQIRVSLRLRSVDMTPTTFGSAKCPRLDQHQRLSQTAKSQRSTLGENAAAGWPKPFSTSGDATDNMWHNSKLAEVETSRLDLKAFKIRNRNFGSVALGRLLVSRHGNPNRGACCLAKSDLVIRPRRLHDFAPSSVPFLPIPAS